MGYLVIQKPFRRRSHAAWLDAHSAGGGTRLNSYDSSSCSREVSLCLPLFHRRSPPIKSLEINDLTTHWRKCTTPRTIHCFQSISQYAPLVAKFYSIITSGIQQIHPSRERTYDNSRANTTPTTSPSWHRNKLSHEPQPNPSQMARGPLLAEQISSLSNPHRPHDQR